jgi:hypothetical protein
MDACRAASAANDRHLFIPLGSRSCRSTRDARLNRDFQHLAGKTGLPMFIAAAVGFEGAPFLDALGFALALTALGREGAQDIENRYLNFRL